MIIKLAAVAYSNPSSTMAQPWDDLSLVAWRLRRDLARSRGGESNEFLPKPDPIGDAAFAAGSLTFHFFDGKIIGEWEGEYPRPRQPANKETE